MSQLKPKTKLIVMRLRDMKRVHPQMRSEFNCSKCGEQVGIYPSGQSVIQSNGRENVEIVCGVCNGPALLGALAPGALQEPFESVPFDPDPTKKQ